MLVRLCVLACSRVHAWRRERHRARLTACDVILHEWCSGGSKREVPNMLCAPTVRCSLSVSRHCSYNLWEYLGAVLMLGGAALSVVPSLLTDDDEGTKWYACLIYFASNIPMAASCVYKERTFRNLDMDVW